jgi:hypothetical protein
MQAVATDPRGFTYSEQHRHECEVRHVAALPTRAERAAYLDERLERKRGKAAADRLRFDVAAAWRASRSSQTPAPEAGTQGAVVCAVHPQVNGSCTEQVPCGGSFLAAPHGGDSDPVRCVVSEGAP